MFNIYIAQIYMCIILWSNALLQAKVDFAEGGKPENPEKNPRSTGETNYNNSTHISSKFFENQHQAGYTQVVTHPAITPIWPGLTVVKDNELSVTRT